MFPCHLPMLPTSQIPTAQPRGVRRVPTRLRSTPSSSLLGTAMAGNMPNMFPTTNIPPHRAIFQGGVADTLIFSCCCSSQPDSRLASLTYSGILHRSRTQPRPK